MIAVPYFILGTSFLVTMLLILLVSGVSIRRGHEDMECEFWLSALALGVAVTVLAAAVINIHTTEKQNGPSVFSTKSCPAVGDTER